MTWSNILTHVKDVYTIWQKEVFSRNLSFCVEYQQRQSKITRQGLVTSFWETLIVLVCTVVNLPLYHGTLLLPEILMKLQLELRRVNQYTETFLTEGEDIYSYYVIDRVSLQHFMRNYSFRKL